MAHCPRRPRITYQPPLWIRTQDRILRPIASEPAPACPCRWMPIPRNSSICSIVILEGVWLLPVDRKVTHGQILIAHAQGNPADVFDEDHDEGSPGDVPADDEEGADDLDADLAAVACHGTAGVSETEGGAAFGCGPEAWTMAVSRMISMSEQRRKRGGEGAKDCVARYEYRKEKRLTYRCQPHQQWPPRNGYGRHQ